MGKHSPQSFKGVREVKMRIGLDCQPLLGTKTGIGWYWHHLLKELAGVSQDDHFFLFGFSHSGKKPNLPEDLMKKANIGMLFPKVFPRTAILGLSRISLGLIPGKFFPKLDLVHFPNFTAFPVGRARIVVTVHDLVYKLFPFTVDEKVRIILELFFPSSLKTAHVIIADSKSTERDLLKFFPFVNGKTRVVYPGLDPIFSPVDDQIAKEAFLQRYHLERYILYVGTLEPRKNLLNLLKAYEKLCRNSTTSSLPDLVLVGTKGWKNSLLFQYFENLNKEIQAKIHFLGYLPREELPILYSCADVFVFPSLYEGFGLPVLEALACGAPVVTSSTSSLPEVGGDVVLYVDPQSPEDIAEKIYALLNDENLGERRNRGVLRAREFSWKKAAMEIYEIYKSIII